MPFARESGTRPNALAPSSFPHSVILTKVRTQGYYAVRLITLGPDFRQDDGGGVAKWEDGGGDADAAAFASERHSKGSRHVLCGRERHEREFLL